MTSNTALISREDPRHPDLALLFQRHDEANRIDTPAESNHMMGAADLAIESVRFFALREGNQVLAMGAWKEIAPNHAELKSMHVLREARGKGLARRMLTHIEADATKAGMHRMSLETGVQPSWLAARALYIAAGYSECPPIPGYEYDPASIFLTRKLV